MKIMKSYNIIYHFKNDLKKKNTKNKKKTVDFKKYY